MKERETSRRRSFGFEGLIVALCFLMMFGFYHWVDVENKAHTEKAIENSSLNQYLLFESSNAYPKFQLEAMDKQRSLINAGMTESSASLEAMKYLEDAVYEDRVAFSKEFYSTHEGAEAIECEEAYMEYLDKSQKL